MSISRSVSPSVFRSVHPASRVPAALVGSSVPSVDIPDLVAYYRFDGNGNDSSGFRNLTIHSGTLVAGKVSGALNSGVASGDFEITLTDITISLWVNIGADDEDSTLKAGFIRLTDGIDQTIEFSWSGRDGEFVNFRWYYNIEPAEDFIDTQLNGVTSDSQWIHAVVTAGSEFNVYLDGQYLNNDNALPMPSEVTSLVINCLEDYNSKVGDVAIWNRALSEAEILQLYNSGSGVNLAV